jgi:hypothetical protein
MKDADLSVEGHRHRQAKWRFIRRTHEPNSELPAGAPDDAAAAPSVSGAGKQEHELSRHDTRHARRIEREPRSGFGYIRQETGVRRRSIAEIDVCPIFEITAQLLAFFSCHLVGSPLVQFAASSRAGPCVPSRHSDARIIGFSILSAQNGYASFTTKLLKNYRERAHSISLIFACSVYDAFTVPARRTS